MRALIGVWLAVNAVVLAAAPIADAATDRSRAMVVHWEDSQDTDCPPPHDPEVCHLCQVVSVSFGSAGPPYWVSSRPRLTDPPPPTGEGLVAQPLALRGSPHPRGPPTS